MGCLASLGNDGILELFELSAKIFGVSLIIVYQEWILMLQTEIWPPKK